MSSLEDRVAAGSSALVTGGAGFIGSNLCNVLNEAGIVVHSVSRRASRTETAHRHWQVDLADAAKVRELVKSIRPDYVFHLASHVMGAPDLSHVLPALHSNLLTTVNLLTAVAEFGCRRMIITGSLAEPVSRTDEPFPPSPYAASKWASSDYARMFHALYRVPIAIARVFMVYGPGQQDLTKLVPYVIRSALRGEPPEISSGHRLIDWIFVDDVAAGLLKLALAANVDGQTVDLGSGTMIRTSDLVEQICDLMAAGIRPRIGALPDRPFEPNRAARVEETFRLLAWSPQVPLAEGLSRTIEFYRGQGC